ncbi:MAG: DNA primase, partial [Cellulomonadaceae bacterium]|nr:DNA primase [Cellulomonadaceae bacterium]
MAGLIKREDVDAVRERARIEDIIGAHVTLKPAGVGSLKGLCPFHDERTPSFNVRPATGRYKCFGCGEGGDVITFVEKIDGLSFAEAVEHLAAMVGVELRYEDSRTGALQAGQGQRGPDAGTRQRLFAANAAAADFYAAQLLTGEAALARKMLFDRSFDRADAERFGVGYAPNVDKGWDNLARYLQGKGFTQAELKAAGLVLDGKRPGSMYDRFRGRLIWPIRDTTGAVVGFGARRLYDDDQGPKYLNTPETPLYKKAKVLYGIDLAKKAIAATKRVVVVEGYTDVMAAHLSGIESAVATCGTAFGAEHARTVERFFHGDRSARLTFTFDGDSAGQAAAVHAYEVVRDLPLVLQAALVPGGMDPCDLRMA